MIVDAVAYAPAVYAGIAGWSKATTFRETADSLPWFPGYLNRWARHSVLACVCATQMAVVPILMVGGVRLHTTIDLVLIGAYALAATGSVDRVRRGTPSACICFGVEDSRIARDSRAAAFAELLMLLLAMFAWATVSLQLRTSVVALSSIALFAFVGVSAVLLRDVPLGPWMVNGMVPTRDAAMIDYRSGSNDVLG